MKILAISASPRVGGNSDMLCDRFLEGAAKAGHETEKINLSQKKISPCTACYACAKKGECVIRDDMAEIQQKLIDAEVILLATPVYFYCMNAQMKAMIDRCLPRYREMQNKQFYLLATAADPQHEAVEETFAGLRGFLRCLPGSVEKGALLGTGAWDVGDVLKLPIYQDVYEAGFLLSRT